MGTKSKRYLGLELGGSRRTAVVCIDYFPGQGKVFLVETRAQLHGTREETADELVLRTINGLAADVIGVDAPLQFPPCLVCEEEACPGALECPRKSVQWMKEESERRGWNKSKYPPPYTHRPVDLLLRGRWQDDSPLPIPAEETMGSGRAPLTARMSYLRRRITTKKLVEVNPRLALVGLAEWYGISVRELRRCRDLQYGAENRFLILNKITAKHQNPEIPHIDLFMTDLVSIAKDLSAFDAYLCAMMALFSELHLLEEPEIDPAWGNIARPKSLKSLRQSRDTWSDL